MRAASVTVQLTPTTQDVPRPAHSAALRAEIQALRAVAVGLVVVYHLWPAAVRGGFVGVDVFFVISGFLITSLLLREVERTGTVSLSAFWARRARRILPAALVTVVLVCGGDGRVRAGESLAAVLRGDARQHGLRAELASGGRRRWITWRPRTRRRRCSTSGRSRSRSSSTSLWPVLIVAALASSAAGRPARRAAVAVAMGAAATGLSLVYSVAHTAADPAAAYFVTPTRIWELGAGALLALAAPAGTGRRSAARAVLSWVGLAAIAVAALAYSTQPPVPRPRRAAAGPRRASRSSARARPTGRWSPCRCSGCARSRCSATSPTRSTSGIGRSSSSRPSSSQPKAPAPRQDRRPHVHRCVRLAYKEPHRGSRAQGRRCSRARRALDVRRRGRRHRGGLAVTLPPAPTSTRRPARTGCSRSTCSPPIPACFGAAARDDQHAGRARTPSLGPTVVPTPLQAAKRATPPATSSSALDRHASAHSGPGPARRADTIALVGDSHAVHWRAAFERHRQGQALARPVDHAHRLPVLQAIAVARASPPDRCIAWNREARRGWRPTAKSTPSSWPSTPAAEVHRAAAARPPSPRRSPDFAACGTPCPPRCDTSSSSTTRRASRPTPRLRRAGVIARPPAPRDDAARAARAGDPARPGVIAAARACTARVQRIDLTRFFCDKRRCSAGHRRRPGLQGHRDHLTDVYATTLGPFLLPTCRRRSSTVGRTRGIQAVRNP